MFRTYQQIRVITPQVLSILISIILGVSLLFFAGHIQSNTLHDAAHDARHSSGFPCH